MSCSGRVSVPTIRALCRTSLAPRLGNGLHRNMGASKVTSLAQYRTLTQWPRWTGQHRDSPLSCRSSSVYGSSLRHQRTAPSPPSPPRVITRASSHSPMGSSSSSPSRKRVTIESLRALYARGEPITMLTAHDFPSAHVADKAGMDMVLVGDSLAMVALGMADTSEVTVDDMLLHCRSVARGTQAAFLVGDLPMGSYEVDAAQALRTAIRFVKEGRMHAVKLEGGIEMADTVARVTSAGISVLGHVGLTPQRQHSLGGFRVQGKTTDAAHRVLRDAEAIQDAGAFAVVLEAVPEPVAAAVTRKLRIPTIGIGAGAGTSGQVLVQADMSGNFPPGRFLPKFVKQFGNVWSEAERAIRAYGEEVKNRTYPAAEHTYPISDVELERFIHDIGDEVRPAKDRHNDSSAASDAEAAQRLKEAERLGVKAGS